jgi:hypothetical protein
VRCCQIWKSRRLLILIWLKGSTTNRSLLLLADYYDASTAPLAVCANLTLNLHLLHGDGTAETGLSRRQDYSTRVVPLSLAACYLYSAFRKADPLFFQAARLLWARAEHAHLGNLCWLTYVLLKFGEPPASTLALPENFAVRAHRTRRAEAADAANTGSLI